MKPATATTWLMLGALSAAVSAAAQDIGRLVGSRYVQHDPAEMEVNGCDVRSSVRRDLEIQPGFKITVKVFGRRQSLSSQCDSGLMDFDLEHDISRSYEGDAEGVFSGVTVRDRDVSEVGTRHRGSWQLLNGGRTLVLTYDGGDGRQAFQATHFSLQPRQRKPYGESMPTPGSRPDLTLACKLIRPTPRDSCSDPDPSRSVLVWLKDKVCNGISCEITAQSFIWTDHDRVDRVTGQLRGYCGVYQCEAVSNGQKF